MSRHVVVVEDQAHLALGHYPDSAATLARGFCELGCSAELLTAQGWLGEGSAEPPPFRVGRVSRPVAALLRQADRLVVDSRRRRPGRRQRVVAEAGTLLRSLGLAAAVRGAVRAGPDGTEVVMYAFGVRPIVAAALNGRGRVLHHAIWRAPGPTPKSLMGRLLDRAARRAEADRRRHGGGMRIAAGNDEILESWRVRTPFLDPVLLRHAVAPAVTRVDGARASLGVADDAKVALVFGTLHASKDLDTVWRAFADLPEWTLLVVGSVAHSYSAWRAGHDGPPAITRPGFVDDAVKATAFSAADVVVLSFVAGHGGDSAVGLDAVGFGVPVVCTEGTRVAADVVRHRLGATFPAGSAEGLAAALAQVPASLAPDDVTAALAESAAAAVAQAHLDAFDGIRPQGPPAA